MIRVSLLIALLIAACADDEVVVSPIDLGPGVLRDADGQHSDRFGSSIAMNGNTIAVAAPFRDTPTPNAGVVILYDRSNGLLSEVARLSRPEEGESVGAWGDQFGSALAMTGSRLAIGAPGVDGELQDVGKVYIFEATTVGWSLEQTLESPAPTLAQRFGSAIALDADFLFVGAAGEDDDSRDVGVVFAFEMTADGYQVAAGLIP